MAGLKRYRYTGKGHTTVKNDAGVDVKVLEGETIVSSQDEQFFTRNGFVVVGGKNIHELETSINMCSISLDQLKAGLENTLANLKSEYEKSVASVTETAIAQIEKKQAELDSLLKDKELCEKDEEIIKQELEKEIAVLNQKLLSVNAGTTQATTNKVPHPDEIYAQDNEGQTSGSSLDDIIIAKKKKK